MIEQVLITYSNDQPGDMAQADEYELVEPLTLRACLIDFAAGGAIFGFGLGFLMAALP